MTAPGCQARPLKIEPPLLNSASPWATTKDDLQALYDCPYTGAVTTRTSLLDGFPHDDAIHQYLFFDAGETGAKARAAMNGHAAPSGTNGKSPSSVGSGNSSLNTLGYSPYPLSYYTSVAEEIVAAGSREQTKPIIFSVTGIPGQIEQAYSAICRLAASGLWSAMEVNLSCPNIDGKPPPAYDGSALAEYVSAFTTIKKGISDAGHPAVPIGIKSPPYTYMGQFKMLVDGLSAFSRPGEPAVDFVTATNTLGSSLVLSEDGHGVDLIPALASEAGTGIGGLAGAALHPLALGNVSTLRRLVDQRKELEGVMIIGVGGVSDDQGYKRMRKVGADSVGLATALGREGVMVFEKIGKGALKSS